MQSLVVALVLLVAGWASGVRHARAARALRAIMDELMLDLMFELPEADNTGLTYVIDDECVATPDLKLRDIPQRRERAAG